MAAQIRMTLEAAFDLARDACLAAGASAAMADVLAEATVSAEAHGVPAVGFSHLPDYLTGLANGQIDGQAVPVISQPMPAVLMADAQDGIAQLAFRQAFALLVETAGRLGVAMFCCRNSFTAGELGWYARELAEYGLVGLVAANGPPLLTVPGADRALYCTNPVAFAVPREDAPPVLIDQSSSATAFVNVRQAAARGGELPEGWAVDAGGKPTIDPAEALQGALLPYGGSRGGNMALMVECLSAGLSGANWSLDCAPLGAPRPMGAGLTVLAIRPDPSVSLGARTARQTARLASHGVHVPGDRKGALARNAETDGISIPADLHAQLSRYRASEG